MKYFKHRMDRVAVHMALWSFVGGSGLLFAYLVLPNEFLLVLGMIYVGIALLVNAIMFVSTLLHALVHYRDLQQHLLALLLLLLNLPIAYLYFLIVVN
ncbi:hypothetical protein WIW50_15120 [Flavobacteriaceae bacterium 3-367]|uniref:hypothetical protein n=1 Tax=Eudoraea algarum TaxID=3417568 RepID=UPI003275C9D5